MDQEASERIKYLNQGPWIELGALAWKTIAKPEGIMDDTLVNSETQLALQRLLRPHWVESINRSEGQVRDSFDEALVVYQLYELAIENGYLDLADIEEQVTTELPRLLWSQGARKYLQIYGYVSVISLAQRAGVNLEFKDIDLPPIRQGSEGRFASFLSQHVLWYEDPILDGWIGFLDDYQVLDGEKKTDKSAFHDFLGTEQEEFANDATLWTFVAGADRFVTRIADLAEALAEKERPSYGLFYAYWLARFYGFTLTGNSYARDLKRIDWSEALSNSKRIKYYNEKRKSSEGNRVDSFKIFKLHNFTVRKLWDDTLSHLGAGTQADVNGGASWNKPIPPQNSLRGVSSAAPKKQQSAATKPKATKKSPRPAKKAVPVKAAKKSATKKAKAKKSTAKKSKAKTSKKKTSKKSKVPKSSGRAAKAKKSKR